MTDPIRPPNQIAVNPAPPMFRMLGISASGMTAHRIRMETVATNVANADTTRTAEGGPYRRRVVELEATPGATFVSALSAAGTPDPEANGVRVGAIVEDATAGPRVYEPGHPDADADGYVTYPNVNVTDEMVELMDARRMFEANSTVFLAAKSMLHRSLEI